MADEDPVWKRVAGGLIGMLLLVALLVIARRVGVGGESVQRWQGIIVAAAALAGTVYMIQRRRRR
jgi:hypothetical protein